MANNYGDSYDFPAPLNTNNEIMDPSDLIASNEQILPQDLYSNIPTSTLTLPNTIPAYPNSTFINPANTTNPDLIFCAKQNRIFSWVIVILLIPFIAFFINKMASLIFPSTDCTAPTVTNPSACLADNATQNTFLYLTIFVLSVIGLVLAVALWNSKTIPKEASLAIAIGSAIGMLIATWSNYNKLNDTIQLIVIGLTTLSIIMLPRYIKSSC